MADTDTSFIEKCASCGDLSGPDGHPVLAISINEATGLASEHAICHQCHVDPSHRKVVLKAAFFELSRTEEPFSPAPPAPSRPLLQAGMEEQFADVLIKAIATVVRPLQRQVAVLKSDIKSRLKYVGTFESDRVYMPADVVTRSGALWICREAHTSGAVFDHRNWQMSTKSR